MKDPKSGQEIQSKCMSALGKILAKCDDLATLNSLMNSSVPAELIKYVLEQFIKVIFISVTKRFFTLNICTTERNGELNNLYIKQNNSIEQDRCNRIQKYFLFCKF